MNAEIITIGDELLIGQVVDTNAAAIAGELNRIGISVRQITTIEDNKSHILETLQKAAGRTDVIIMSGGLGPTKDDVTKYTLCDYFEDTLIKDQEVLDHIEELFKKLNNIPVTDLNREQAMVPTKATVLFNKYGTAPGLWMEKEDTVYIAVPGVPFEMKKLMEDIIIPKLKERFHRPFIHHKTIRTYGLGESSLAKRIEEWEDNLPAEIKLAYLPDLGSVRLRLSGKGENEKELKQGIEQQLDKLYPLIEDIISDKIKEDDDIAVTISKLLISAEQFLCAAESCTGGELAAMFTTNPGASSCFKGGIVTYSTESKKNILKVPGELIEKHSVVSREVAEEMARNAGKLFRSHYAISTTGNAGPKKGESQAEVGTVFIGILTPQRTFSKEYMFDGDREQVVKKAVNKAFELILRELTKNNFGKLKE